jgi:ArsR family transcriptional regulator
LLTIYQCFGDETRLRILNVLLRGPLYVKQIMRALSLPQALISRHLAYLRRKGLVRANRDGNLVEYSLPGIQTDEVQANLEVLERFAPGVEVYERDLKELGRMRRRRRK